MHGCYNEKAYNCILDIVEIIILVLIQIDNKQRNDAEGEEKRSKAAVKWQNNP